MDIVSVDEALSPDNNAYGASNYSDGEEPVESGTVTPQAAEAFPTILSKLEEIAGGHIDRSHGKVEARLAGIAEVQGVQVPIVTVPHRCAVAVLNENQLMAVLRKVTLVSGDE